MTATPRWRTPPARIRLSNRIVHVWRERLDVGADVLARCEAHLSAPERERMARYRVERKRREFALTRGRLREILGTALGVEPRALEFAYAAHGKPFLAGPARGGAAFNVSHSHEIALIGLTRGREIGIDVEKVRARVEYGKVARRFFSPREVEALMALPAADREAGFFNGWTRKEAVIKGIGRGIGLGLARFDVSLAPGQPPALLATRWDPGEVARWSLVDLRVGPGYAGALAATGRDFEVRGWAID